MLAFKVLAIFFMGAAIGVLYRIPRSVLVYGSINGTAAWLAIHALTSIGANIVAASFVGSLVVGGLAEFLARLLRKPATIFVIPGFIPLVPGREAYTTMRLLVEGEYLSALSMGIQTLLMAWAIAFGIFVSITIYRLTITHQDKEETNNVDAN
jgi:uncharacterized membrane protein YjjB (DUF3815 family)